MLRPYRESRIELAKDLRLFYRGHLTTEDCFQMADQFYDEDGPAGQGRIGRPVAAQHMAFS